MHYSGKAVLCQESVCFFQDQIDNPVLDNDGLDQFHAGHLALDFLIRQGSLDDGVLVGIGVDHDGAAQFAVDLHGHLTLFVDGFALIICGPGHLHGHFAFGGSKAELFPHLLRQVRGKGAEQQKEGLEIALGAAVFL